jgi:two-component system NtrC family sensor kinase
MPSRTAALAAQKAEEAADLGRLLQNVPRAIESSLDGLDRIAAIVRSMQEFAPPQQGEMAAVDLNRAITNTLTVASNEYRGVADVETILGDIPLVPCRGGDLNQVILEVVINAAHAIADVVGDSGERGRIEVRTWREGDAVALSISDTGAGIPADIRGRIFDPFFTTKVVGRGTGQGLAIARAVVVERHGGALTFDTEVGKGSTFFIRLPLQPRRSGGTSPPFRPSAAS